MALLVNSFCMYCAVFFGSFLAVHFSEHYGVTEKQMGMYFITNTLPYLVCAMTFNHWAYWIPKRL